MVKLYSLDKKGKIRVFEIEVELTGPTSPNTAYIHTKTGLLDGQLTTKKTTITEGKQNRSINQQAELESESLIKEKKDEGYKSEDMLIARILHLKGEKERVWIEGSSIDLLFATLSIKHNTNQYWLPLPMLAEKWKDKKKSVKYPAFIQPKLNGVRCIAKWVDDKEGVVLLSRGGQKYIMPHISKELEPHLQYKPEIQLDGELYRHGMPLQTIAGIVKLEDESQFHRKLAIEYHIYDTAQEGLIQHSRLSAVDAYVQVFNCPFIKKVDTNRVLSPSEVQLWHDQFVAKGYEGAIVRDFNGFYQFGFRDSCLLKVKEFIDEEFQIIGCDIDESKGIESFVFVLENNISAPDAYGGTTLTFKARPTGSLEDKQIWYTNIAKYIGKKATVRYQERTKDGLPHQAHVRHKDTPLLLEAVRDYE